MRPYFQCDHVSKMDRVAMASTHVIDSLKLVTLLTTASVTVMPVSLFNPSNFYRDPSQTVTWGNT